ncbi:hypothetical protein YC2023_116282 [Brassica napus]
MKTLAQTTTSETHEKSSRRKMQSERMDSVALDQRDLQDMVWRSQEYEEP